VIPTGPQRLGRVCGNLPGPNFRTTFSCTSRSRAVCATETPRSLISFTAFELEFAAELPSLHGIPPVSS
jgi:hypothetical protein